MILMLPSSRVCPRAFGCNEFSLRCCVAPPSCLGRNTAFRQFASTVTPISPIAPQNFLARSAARVSSASSSDAAGSRAAAAATRRGRDMSPELELVYEDELDDQFSGLAGEDGLMTVAGFGSLLSERSARFTFPNLTNFRMGQVHGWRRVFAHTADVFFARGIARPDTGEIASLSLERCGELLSRNTLKAPITPAAVGSQPPPVVQEPPSPLADGADGAEGGGGQGGAEGGGGPAVVVVSLFEVPATPASVAAFIAREHEFRFVAVEPTNMAGRPIGRKAVICARNTDADYRLLRCPPEEWGRRWAPYGISHVWRADVLPCRTYLRHCVLAARSLGPQAERSFMRATFLADRTTTIGEYLERNPDIMDERPPPELSERYNG